MILGVSIFSILKLTSDVIKISAAIKFSNKSLSSLDNLISTFACKLDLIKLLFLASSISAKTKLLINLILFHLILRASSFQLFTEIGIVFKCIEFSLSFI